MYAAQYVSIYTITSSSMEPTLEKGERILCIQQDQYNVGDIITYSSEGTPHQASHDRITHRIIHETPKGYVTQGDNNDNADDYIVDTDQVICKVTASTTLI